jgi:histidinol-phosphatase
MYEPELAFALSLADRAAEIAMGFYEGGFDVHVKPDSTPVTEADTEVEHELRAMLGVERRRDAILGEEQGASGRGRRRWIVDPIDGTRNYARGIPVWATLIALEDDGELRLGVVSAPALGRRWWAERRLGAYAGERRLRVSSVERIEDAVLCFALDRPLPEIAFRCRHARGFGDFWAHMLVAEGAVDGAVDAVGVSEWDLAAVQVIVEEAGGRFSDFAGDPRIDGGSAVSSNGLLHEELLSAIQGQTAPV